MLVCSGIGARGQVIDRSHFYEEKLNFSAFGLGVTPSTKWGLLREGDFGPIPAQKPRGGYAEGRGGWAGYFAQQLFIEW